MVGIDRRSRARSAIRDLALDLGLPTELIILSERWNTVARLGNSGVVARVATLADLVREDSLETFRREVSVSRILAEGGAPAQNPIGDVEIHDGFAISFWHYVDGKMGEASKQAMVSALAQIHHLGQDIKLDQPWFATVAHEVPLAISRLNDQSILNEQHALELREHFERTLADVIEFDLPGGLIHGDAQRKNAIAVGDGAIWIDFEDCCVGPHAWDLACLTKNPNYPTEHVLDEYAKQTGTNRIPSSAMKPLWALRDLEALTWMLSIQEDRESEFGESAQKLLSEVLVAANAG